MIIVIFGFISFVSLVPMAAQSAIYDLVMSQMFAIYLRVKGVCITQVMSTKGNPPPWCLFLRQSVN